MALSDDFKHQGIVAKRLTSTSSTRSLRRSYSTNADGVRPWIISLNSNEEQEFDTIEDAQAFLSGMVQKGMRRVKTPAGARKFKVPIGTPITPGMGGGRHKGLADLAAAGRVKVTRESAAGMGIKVSPGKPQAKFKAKRTKTQRMSPKAKTDLNRLAASGRVKITRDSAGGLRAKPVGPLSPKGQASLNRLVASGKVPMRHNMQVGTGSHKPRRRRKI